MDTEEIDYEAVQNLLSGRFSLVRARVWALCPIRPGSIRMTWINPLNNQTTQSYLNNPNWKKYNNTNWWIADILVHHSCTLIGVQTVCPGNIGMLELINKPENHPFRALQWFGIPDPVKLDWWHTIDLTEKSLDWDTDGPWQHLQLDPIRYMFAGTSTVFVALFKKPVGIAAL